MIMNISEHFKAGMRMDHLLQKHKVDCMQHCSFQEGLLLTMKIATMCFGHVTTLRAQPDVRDVGL